MTPPLESQRLVTPANTTPANTPSLQTALVYLQDEQAIACLQGAGLLSATSLANARHLQLRSADTSAPSILAVLLKTASVSEASALQALCAHSGLAQVARASLLSHAPAVLEACSALGISPAWCSQHKIALWSLSQLANPTDDPGTNPTASPTVSPSASPGNSPTAAPHYALALSSHPGPLLHAFLQQCMRLRQLQFSVVLALPSDLDVLHNQLAHSQPFGTTLGASTGNGLDLAHLRELAEEGPVIELVSSVLSRAATARASDIHFEPQAAGFDVRLRVDGVMELLGSYAQLPYEAVVCRIKILSALDIAERRLPQDGRLDARVNGLAFDVRVSVIPAAKGESVVLRLLQQERAPQQLGDLGLSARHTAQLQSWLDAPNGLVLVTGPTGSGKSTTLYTAMDLLGKKTDKIVTVEDPVEYKLPGITQIQVNTDIGLDFATALRSILRHDPDVILVGEIRDAATAQIATQAALTGHLVLSTLHTNTAAGAVTRLLDLGVDSFLLADSLRGVMAQRLVRKLCNHCSQAHNPDVHGSLPRWVQQQLQLLDQAQNYDHPHDHPHSQSLQAVALEATALRQPNGCAQCKHTGYLGRVGIYDLVNFAPQVAALVQPGVTASTLEAALAQQQGYSPWSDAWHKVLHGTTSWQEVARNISASELHSPTTG